ncbi:hypothetical protein BDR03DRAFT_936615 [Suillus americanus]|nr:hypothetical protein BDR03DRAFT_936615 [Suillus americanus]
MAEISMLKSLSLWPKEFKRDWLHAANTPIMIPLNPKYRPDPHCWVCTCPNFVKTWFLICKHLIQSVHPVVPTFFLEVQWNHTIPFWTHPLLVPLDSCPLPLATAATPVPGEMESGDEVGDGVEDDLVDMFCQQLDTKTFQERMLTHVGNICDFCDGLEMLTVLKCNGSSFLCLADNCLSREQRENLS